MLNSDQIVEKGLLKLEQSKGKKAQVGYDLSLQEVKQIRQNPQDKIGVVLKNKTNLADYTKTEKVQLDGKVVKLYGVDILSTDDTQVYLASGGTDVM